MDTAVLQQRSTRYGVYIDVPNLIFAYNQVRAGNVAIDWKVVLADIKARMGVSVLLTCRAYMQTMADPKIATIRQDLINAGLYVLRYRSKEKRGKDIDGLVIQHLKEFGEMAAGKSNGNVKHTAVLVSGDGDYIPTVEKLTSKGVDVILYAPFLSTNRTLKKKVREFHPIEKIPDVFKLKKASQ